MERLLGEILKLIQQAVRECFEEFLGKKEEELLLPDQLADKLKVPISWVYEMSRTGNIPTHRVGRYIRFKLSEVLEHLKREE